MAALPVVPLLCDSQSVEKLIRDSCLADKLADVESMSKVIINRMGEVGRKTALQLTERAIFTAGMQLDEAADDETLKSVQVSALENILEDLVGDEAMTARVCEVI